MSSRATTTGPVSSMRISFSSAATMRSPSTASSLPGCFQASGSRYV